MVRTDRAMASRFAAGAAFPEFLNGVSGRHPWRALYDRAQVPDDLLERARQVEGVWHLLAVAEEWCGDGANTLPYLARLTEAVPSMDLRILRRDEHPDLMDCHLTCTARAIPVVLILDEAFREVRWWGPRPQPLQDLFHREIEALSKPDRYPRLRAWYARDRGRTTLEEILSLLPVSP